MKADHSMMSAWQSSEKMQDFKKGCMSGLSIAIGYFPIAVTFGLIAMQTAGLSLSQSTLMSIWVFAGASQYIAIELISAKVSALEIIIATFILNLRHFLMSTVLSQQLLPSRWNILLSFGITDETFAVASMSTSERRHQPFYFAGIALAAYSSWIVGTMAGVLFANLIPPSIGQSMGIALYAMFIGLLIPAARRSWKIISVASVSALLSWAGLSLFPEAKGWAIVSATILTTTLAMFVFRPTKVKGEQQ